MIGTRDETYDSRIRNCIRSPKHARICGRLNELGRTCCPVVRGVAIGTVGLTATKPPNTSSPTLVQYPTGYPTIILRFWCRNPLEEAPFVRIIGSISTGTKKGLRPLSFLLTASPTRYISS